MDTYTVKKKVYSSVRKEINSLVHNFATRWGLLHSFVYGQVYNEFLAVNGLENLKGVLWSGVGVNRLSFFQERGLLIKLLIFTQEYLHTMSERMENYFDIIKD